MRLYVKRQQKFGYAVEASNYKHQTTNEFRCSKFQTEENRLGHLKMKFGIYLEFAIWDLEFQPCLVPATPG